MRAPITEYVLNLVLDWSKYIISFHERGVETLGWFLTFYIGLMVIAIIGTFYEDIRHYYPELIRLEAFISTLCQTSLMLLWWIMVMELSLNALLNIVTPI